MSIATLESVVRVLTRNPDAREALNEAIRVDPAFLAGAGAQIIGFGLASFLVVRAISSGMLPPLPLLAASGLLGAIGARMAGSSVVRHLHVIEAQYVRDRGGPRDNGAPVSSQRFGWNYSINLNGFENMTDLPLPEDLGMPREIAERLAQGGADQSGLQGEGSNNTTGEDQGLRPGTLLDGLGWLGLQSQWRADPSLIYPDAYADQAPGLDRLLQSPDNNPSRQTQLPELAVES